MTEPTTSACTLVGDIRPSDYLAVTSRLILKPPWLPSAGVLIIVGVIVIAALCIQLLCPEDERNLVVDVVCPVLIASTAYFVVCDKVLRRMSSSYYQKHAVVPNMGQGTYEIIGSEMHFSGTMYDCTVPISSIREIVMCDGVTLLVFSNASGFVIPRTITSGDLETFVSQLRARMHAPVT